MPIPQSVIDAILRQRGVLDDEATRIHDDHAERVLQEAQTGIESNRKLFAELFGDDEAAGPQPKRGEEIFDGVDYPREWAGFVGQEGAKEQLRVQVASATARGVRLEHTLLASGLHGVGKTTLATMLAYQARVGFMQTTGPLTVAEARNLMRSMRDRDILFIDEIHLMVAGNRNKADWLLPFMTEGVLYTERAAEKMPDITIVGATTDAGKLPETLLSRFMVQPDLVPYSPTEGAGIALSLAARMGVDLPEDVAPLIASAADQNPRAMRRIVTAVRDLQYAYPETHPNLEKALDWAGLSVDGLSKISRDILLILLSTDEETMSLETIKGQLHEPGPIKYHEQSLLKHRLIDITGRGRRLTPAGRSRALKEARQRAGR